MGNLHQVLKYCRSEPRHCKVCQLTGTDSKGVQRKPEMTDSCDKKHRIDLLKCKMIRFEMALLCPAEKTIKICTILAQGHHFLGLLPYINMEIAALVDSCTFKLPYLLFLVCRSRPLAVKTFLIILV